MSAGAEDRASVPRDALERLLAWLSAPEATALPADAASAAQALRQALLRPAVTPGHVLDAVRAEFAVWPAAVRGRQRGRHVVLARKAMILVANRLCTGSAFATLPELLGRDRTTIAGQLRDAEHLDRTNTPFAVRVARVTAFALYLTRPSSSGSDSGPFPGNEAQ